MSEAPTVKSKIMNPGEKFVVNDETVDGSFGPGTTGFAAYVKGHDQDFPNVYFLRAVIIRRGKGGKIRLEQADLSTPIFDISAKGMEKVSPEAKRKYYVKIDPECLPCVPVEELETYDFLGWAFATTLFFQKLAGHAQHFRVWPEDGEHVLNRAKLMEDFYSEDPDYVEEDMASPPWRELFVRMLRPIQSTLGLSTLIYKHRVAGLEKQAAETLYHHHSKENFILAKERLTNVVNACREKRKRLNTLMTPKKRSSGLTKGVIINGDLQ